MPDALSLCFIVKNEDRRLPRCLASLRELPAELIVVDTGSTDQTPRIACHHGAKVIPFSFKTVDFSAARNHAIANAGGRWILMLDADETLAPISVPLLRSLIESGENAGYFLERHNHGAETDTSNIDHVVRLFPNNPAYRYQGRVHETIDASILAAGGKLLPTSVRLDHTFSPDPEARRRKNLWYIDILNEEIAANPTDASRLDFLAAEYHQLGMFQEAAEIAERIVSLRPADPRAHLFAGVYHLLYTSNPAQARADFNEALRLRPGYPEAESFLRRLEAGQVDSSEKEVEAKMHSSEA